MNHEGRYKANFTKGGLMVPESRIVADLLLQGITGVGWKQAIEIDNVLRKRSPTTASTKAALIRARLRTMTEGLWRLVRDGSKPVATHAAFAATIKQTLKGQVETQASIAHINQAQQNAQDAADEAFDKIETASKPKEKPGIGEKQPPVYVKKRRIVQAASLAPKGFLETQADVDGYLDRLRRELEAAIGAGERIEIR